MIHTSWSPFFHEWWEITKMLKVYVDGASNGNPGASAVGIILKKKGIIQEKSEYIGEYSNHEAELIAVIKGLRLCKQHFPNEIISIRSDSKLVVDMMEKGFTKNNSYAPLLHEIMILIRNFPHCFIKWIPDSQNKQADRLARTAIQLHKANNESLD